MSSIKKHYEKVLLSIVLLGLAVAAAALPLQVSHVRQFLDETVTREVRRDPKPFKPLDDYLKTNETVLHQFSGPVEFNFSTPHNVFNPVTWRKRPDGRLEKILIGTEGPTALVVTNIDELRLVIQFDKAEPNSANPDQFRYFFTIIKDTDPNPRKSQTAVLGQPNALFQLTKVDGPPGEPTALHLQFKEPKHEVVVAKEKPFVAVIGHAADMLYPRDNKPFLRVRKNSTLNLPRDPEKYKIVAITTNEVVLSAESTGKRTAIAYHPSPK
ncbi:MAG: hypothetical protein HYY23_01750 [Verrucomicrobia bacterium]|nr:hypothetical protein [Verrucomicrobiota bacterium]